MLLKIDKESVADVIFRHDNIQMVSGSCHCHIEQSAFFFNIIR